MRVSCVWGAYAICRTPLRSRLGALEVAVQRRVTASSVWADLNTAVAARSRYDIEAALACAAAMNLNFSGVSDRAHACLQYLKDVDSVQSRLKFSLKAPDARLVRGGPSLTGVSPALLVWCVRICAYMCVCVGYVLHMCCVCVRVCAHVCMFLVPAFERGGAS
jgi:hypothetical protein